MADEIAVFRGDIVVLGGIWGLTSLAYPAQSIYDAAVAPGAAISASKCEKAPSPTTFQSGTAQDETRMLRVVKGATGTLKHFTVSNVLACAGASVVTVDLQKNGVTVLTAVVTLNAATGDRGEEVGVISTAAVEDGDVLEAVINATQSGTDALATGVFAQVEMDADYAA